MAIETTNPTRSPGEQLVSQKQGDIGDFPHEFVSSVVVETITQTGISTTNDIVNATDAILCQSELNQTLTREKSIVQKNADFTGVILPQLITDPIIGIAALIDKSIVPTLGGVYQVNVTNAGTGYDNTTTATSPAPPGGLAAQYQVNVDVSGVIDSITVTDPGSGYFVAPVVTITGIGSGGAATALIPVIPLPGKSITSITTGSVGSGYTAAVATTTTPTNGVAATLGTTISGDGVTVFIITAGIGYMTVPVITITGDGTGATATAVLGWDTFYDITPLNKWKSIQIASKIDINSLPLELVLPKMQRLAMPDTLVSISGQWISELGNSKTENANPPGLAGTAHATEDGGVNVQIASGFRGFAKGEFHRLFFSSLPTQSNLPTPTIIIPSLGTAVVNAKGDSISVYYTQFSASGSFSGMVRAHSISIGPVLTNGVTPTNTTDSQSENISDSISGGSLTASYNITANSSGTITVSIPTSTPTHFSSGDVIILDGEVTQWRFGIFVLEYNKAFYP